MAVFNSLGSNYTLSFVLKALSNLGRKQDLEILKKRLSEKYSGEVVLTYKGREALSLALQLCNLKESDYVGINGFTCYVVEKAVSDLNQHLFYIDIDPKTLNFTAEGLKKEVGRNPNLKVVVIQNTLGYPCEGEEISQICQEKNLVLIEDLAHCVGTTYKNGQEAGTLGDLVILSFSQDKIVDGGSGGAVVIRNQNFRIPQNLEWRAVGYYQQLLDRLYPLLTFIIRKTYLFKFGEVLHWLLKKSAILTSPINPKLPILMQSLPSWCASLVVAALEDLPTNLGHRQKIARIYRETLDKEVVFDQLTPLVANSTNLRFPIKVEKRDELILFLKNQGIYVSDIWYDSPIGPKKYLHFSIYRSGSCPQGEQVARKILNLPTHQDVTENEARKISGAINQWLKQN